MVLLFALRDRSSASTSTDTSHLPAAKQVQRTNRRTIYTFEECQTSTTTRPTCDCGAVSIFRESRVLLADRRRLGGRRARGIFVALQTGTRRGPKQANKRPLFMIYALTTQLLQELLRFCNPPNI